MAHSSSEFASPRQSASQKAGGRRGGRVLGWSVIALAALCIAGCADHAHQLVVSIPEQRMVVLKNGVPQEIYPVSTSRFGLSNQPGRYGTPLGRLEISEKIGPGLPPGAVLKNREPTGEILAPNAPGRDPVVARILWLRGLDTDNQNAHERYIYIHGTPEERHIGQPASFGCVRMRSMDVIALYDEVGKGAQVYILDQPLASAAAPLLAAGASVLPSVPLPDADNRRAEVTNLPSPEHRPSGHVRGSSQ